MPPYRNLMLLCNFISLGVLFDFCLILNITQTSFIPLSIKCTSLCRVPFTCLFARYFFYFVIFVVDPTSSYSFSLGTLFQTSHSLPRFSITVLPLKISRPRPATLNFAFFIRWISKNIAEHFPAAMGQIALIKIKQRLATNCGGITARNLLVTR